MSSPVRRRLAAASFRDVLKSGVTWRAISDGSSSARCGTLPQTRSITSGSVAERTLTQAAPTPR